MLHLKLRSTTEGKVMIQGSNIKDLIAYQDGSIVSKEIASKPSGKVRIFAFDDGQGLSKHTETSDALLRVLDGAAMLTTADKVRHLKEGEMVIMPAGEPYALTA